MSEIETFIDPFIVREPQEIHTPASTSVTPEIGSSPVISSNHIMQLNVSTTGAISNVTVQPVDVHSNQATAPCPTVINAGQFQLKFLTPLIKVCAGCRKPYNRASDGKSPPPPPMDLRRSSIFILIMFMEDSSYLLLPMCIIMQICFAHVKDVLPLIQILWKFQKM